MKQLMFTVFDVKADAYMTPFFAITDGIATRHFMDAVADKEHPFGRNPEDYTLLRCGKFDDSDGHVDSQVPVLLMTGLEARRKVAKATETAQLDLVPKEDAANG